MKVIRIILLYRQSLREIRRLVHPHAVIPVKVGGQKTSDTVISAVWGFFFLYIANFAVMTILLTATGLDADISTTNNAISIVFSRRRLHHQPRPGAGPGGAQLRQPE